MRSLSHLFLLSLASFLVLFSSACEPECEDGQVEANLSDLTPPDLYWEVTQSSMTPSGPISAISLVTDDDATVFFDANETVTLTLVAADTESGISSIDVIGGFGVTCSGPGGAIAYSGIFPEAPDTYPLSGDCAEVEVKYADIVIEGPNLCSIPENPNPGSAGYELNGTATNHAGITVVKKITVELVGGGS